MEKYKLITYLYNIKKEKKFNNFKYKTIYFQLLFNRVLSKSSTN